MSARSRIETGKAVFRAKEFADAVRTRISSSPIREVAAKVGVSTATLSRLQNQKGTVPDLVTYARICAWLGVSTEVYLSGPMFRVCPECGGAGIKGIRGSTSGTLAESSDPDISITGGIPCE